MQTANKILVLFLVFAVLFGNVRVFAQSAEDIKAITQEHTFYGTGSVACSATSGAAVSGASLDVTGVPGKVEAFVKSRQKALDATMPRYLRISAATGAPWQIIAATHMREGISPTASILDGRKPPYLNPDGHGYIATIEQADDITIKYIKGHFSYWKESKAVYVNGKSGQVKSTLTADEVKAWGAAWKTGGWWFEKGRNLDDHPYLMNYADATRNPMVWQSWMTGDVGSGKIAAGTKESNPGLVLIYAYLVKNSSGQSLNITASSSTGCPTTNATQPTSGNFVFFSQNDDRWGKLAFNGGNVEGDGCGLTSYSMIAATFKQDASLTPKKVLSDINADNYSPSGLVGERMANYGEKKYGLSAKKIYTPEQVKSALQSGAMVISGGAYGPYRFKSHIIVLKSIDADGTVHVADPEDNTEKDRKYNLSEFFTNNAGKYFVAVSK